MNRVWKNICVVMLLLCSGSFAAFIQKPIPPSSEKNYFYDVDGDGHMDALRVCFIGRLSQGYVDSVLMRLDFEWLSSKESPKLYSVKNSKFMLDSTDTRCIDVNLKSMQEDFANWTELANPALTTSKIGSAKLYLADSVVFPLKMRDGMAPAIVDNFLRCHRDGSLDTLIVNFSERVRHRGACASIFEQWSSVDSSVHVLQPVSVTWTANDTKAVLVFDSSLASGYRLSLQDSIRATGCVVDSSDNSVSGKSPFMEIYGFYPLEIYTSKLVQSDVSMDADSLFQLEFDSEMLPLPNENAWGIAVDLFGDGFERAVREALMMNGRETLRRSDFTVKMGVKIYSSAGSFVASTNVNVKGDDSRFVQDPTRLFLKWNLMDSRHRKVGTGAYIAHVSATILYKNKVVFRDSWQKDVSSFTFGVMRR